MVLTLAALVTSADLSVSFDTASAESHTWFVHTADGCDVSDHIHLRIRRILKNDL